MNALLSLSQFIIAYADASANSNPSLKFVDWKRTQSAIQVTNPGSQALTLGPKTATLVFDSSRSTLLDGSTEFTLTASPLVSSGYRFTWTNGTNPVLRADRLVSTVGIGLTLTANTNGTLTMLAGSGSPFINVVVGDTVFVPGVTTGDADAGFDPTNEGLWTVLGRTDTILTLVRDGDFSGVSEVVVPAADDMLVYAPTGVLVSDRVDISAGFSTSVFGNYEITAVTSNWFEIVSTSPLAPEVAAPGVGGMAFYLNAQRFIRIEADRECVIRINGDTGNTTRISPLTDNGVAYYEKTGLTWSLSIFNYSILPAMISVITAE